jgi:hypothetical protein
MAKSGRPDDFFVHKISFLGFKVKFGGSDFSHMIGLSHRVKKGLGYASIKNQQVGRNCWWLRSWFAREDAAAPYFRGRRIAKESRVAESVER